MNELHIFMFGYIIIIIIVLQSGFFHTNLAGVILRYKVANRLQTNYLCIVRLGYVANSFYWNWFGVGELFDVLYNI